MLFLCCYPGYCCITPLCIVTRQIYVKRSLSFIFLDKISTFSFPHEKKSLKNFFLDASHGVDNPSNKML